MFEQEGRDGIDNVIFPCAKLRVLTLCPLVNIGEVAARFWDPVDRANRFAVYEINPLVALGHCRQVFLGHQEAGVPISVDQRFANLVAKISTLIPVYS